MKPEYLKHTEIDFVKWDNCVQASENHLPYCYSWYLNIVSPGWEALVLGDYEKIFPLTFRKKAAVNYLFQPYFTQQLGIFGIKVCEQDLNDFISAIPQKFKFIEINLNNFCTLKTKGLLVKSKVTHHLILKNNYDELSSLFNDNTKRNIRKAEKTKLKLVESGSVQSLINLFKKNAGSKTELIKKDYSVLELLMNSSISKNIGRVYEVQDEKNNLQASLFLLSSKNILINLFNASSVLGRKNSAMFFLINEVLKLNAGNKKIFDFEGSEIAEVARFYKGFGGIPVAYSHIRVNRLPWPLKWIKK